MILIDESQRDLLRIAWKDRTDSPEKIFQLSTVSYGTKSAPYLATRSLKQLAIDDGDKYPLAAEVIMSDVDIDYLLTGADDLQSGRKLQVKLVSMLKVLLSKLLKRTSGAFKVNISQIYLWTDSSIDLTWIKKPLAELKIFVRNRVNIIQELTESDFWKHVNSENNPADFLSRGIRPNKIQHCELWWLGPSFLHQFKELEPYDIIAVEGDDLFLQELKETSDFPVCALLKNFEPLDIISNCSSFTKLQRVIAWCKQFIENARHPMSRSMGPLKIKAIHLEIVSDLTTEAFLAALKRFVARRGRPIEIHSDNGRNFVGANNELRKILKALFKVGSSLVAIPDPDYTEIPMSRLSRWQLVQKMNQHFWRKCSSEYLNRLQQRPKWYRWIPRGVSFQRPRHRLIAVASLGRLPRNRSIPVWFTRYPRTALSDRWRSLGITSLMNIGGIRYVHIHSYIGHHDQACVLACKIQCISKFHEIKLKS
ncbi:uncharacterized protein TNCV_1497981 [Trichonephila clavipes]|nr:uncharacterized protein TNCV_1497981 [Trichonephila clavipes]